MSGAPASGISSGGRGAAADDDDADVDEDEPEEAMPETELPTASRGYSAPGRSPASTTAAGAIVPTVVEGIFFVQLRGKREREGKGQKALSLSQIEEE